jgi:branched-chain amino acid transport system substrate-binding protein
VAQKFADAGVKFVLGPYNSGVAIPASRVYNDAGIADVDGRHQSQDHPGGYKNVFRIVASDSQVGGAMANYAAKELKVKNVGVIDDRTAFGQGIADRIQAPGAGRRPEGRRPRVHQRQGQRLRRHPHRAAREEGRRHLLRRLCAAGRADGAPDEGARPERAAARRRHPVQPGDGQARRPGRRRERAVRAGRRHLDKQPAARPSRRKYKQRFKREPDVYAPRSTTRPCSSPRP